MLANYDLATFLSKRKQVGTFTFLRATQTLEKLKKEVSSGARKKTPKPGKVIQKRGGKIQLICNECTVCFAFLSGGIFILHIPVNGHSLLLHLLSDSKWSTTPEFQHSLDAALVNACLLFKQGRFQQNVTIYGIPWQVKIWMPYKKEPWKQNTYTDTQNTPNCTNSTCTKTGSWWQRSGIQCDQPSPWVARRFWTEQFLAAD